METKSTSLGSSLLVPCIQELAKQSLDSIPPRYIQLEHRDQSTISISDDDDGSISQIPVIDLQKLRSDESELTSLDLACRQWGFFQLVNHGVDSSLLEKVKAEIQDFFNLPMEEKKKFWQSPEDIQGFGQAFVVSEDQKLDWADIFFMITLPYHSRKPHLFPKLPLSLGETLETYSAKLQTLSMALLQKMAKALGLRSKEIDELFAEGLQSMRMNYYPPCPQPEKVIGLTPHSDAVGLTILLQLNEIEGLQVKQQGKWVPVKPLPNSFIINVGDIVEIITNGAYKSIEHRATVNSTRERLSIATFHSPRYDCKIGPAPSLISDKSPAVFRTVSKEEYSKGVLSRKLDGKSNLDTLRIQVRRSHSENLQGSNQHESHAKHAGISGQGKAYYGFLGSYC